MIGFAVYATTVDPGRLYSAGDTGAIDADVTRELVWAGDRPLELVVDLDDRRVWWAFEADRETKARRTGHFIAAYHGGLDLFSGFADELRALHETDGWDLSPTGGLEQTAGFELRGLSPAFEGEDRFDRLVDRLEARDGSTATPVRVGMSSYRRALEAIRTLEVRNVGYTVAIDTAGGASASEHVDLVLVPGAGRDFDVRSGPGGGAGTPQDTRPPADSRTGLAAGPSTEAGARPTAGPSTEAGARPTPGPSTEAGARPTPGSSGEKSVEAGAEPDDARTLTGFSSRIAGIALVGLFGFAAYSFVQRQPVVPISGLGMFGGFLGACAAIVTGRTLRQGLTDDLESAVLLVTGGAFAGFVFPRVVWEVGLAAGRGGFLFGSLATPSGAFPATIVYVGFLYVATVAVLTLGSRGGYTQPVTAGRLTRMSTGFVLYGLCLLLATGLAEPVWYGFIPAA